jgi:phosphate transport system substrate-binding protein
LSRRGRRALVVLAPALLAGSMLLSACAHGIGGPDKTSTAQAGAQTSPAPTNAAATPSGTGSVTPISIPADVGKDDTASLTGAGSTFAAPLYSRWGIDYKANVSSGVQVNYQSIGSGGGINALKDGIVDFGATDAPMTDADIAKAKGPVQHIPTALGAIVITYNLPGLSQPLRLDGDTIARIYLGKITKWNDSAIAGQNQGAKLPDADIAVVHRSDGSGTSFIFTDYLSSVSADWKDAVGTSKNPSWPIGLGGQGNEGVSQQVKQNENSIGYIELGYAQTNKLPLASIKDQGGDYVQPTTDSTSLAASGVAIPEDYRVSIVNSPSKGAYPIAGFTWIVLYKEQTDAAKAKALVDFLWWGIHDGQRVEPSLGYAPLPKDLVTSIEKTLTTNITVHGEPVLRAP